MKIDLDEQIKQYVGRVVRGSEPIDLDSAGELKVGFVEMGDTGWAASSRVPPSRRRSGWVPAAVAAAAMVLLALVPLFVNRDDVSTAANLAEPEPTPSIVSDVIAPPPNPTTLDPSGWVDGDDGSAPLPLGEVTVLPGGNYLDFMSRDCPSCFLDARFKGPGLSDFGSGPWVAGREFFVREGFVNSGSEPLGDGFDVELFVTRWSGPDVVEGGFELGQTYRFTSDYVMRGEAQECGPTYATQTGAVTCEWFVHDFPDGIPDGRYDLWAAWFAPCSAWLDMGLAQSCSDPGEVMNLFSSSVNSPFGPDESSLDGF